MSDRPSQQPERTPQPHVKIEQQSETEMSTQSETEMSTQSETDMSTRSEAEMSPKPVFKTPLQIKLEPQSEAELSPQPQLQWPQAVLPTVPQPVLPTVPQSVLPTVPQPVLPTVPQPVLPTVSQPLSPTVPLPMLEVKLEPVDGEYDFHLDSDSSGMSLSPQQSFIKRPTDPEKLLETYPGKVDYSEFKNARVACNSKEKIIIALDRSRKEDLTPFLDGADNDYSPFSLLKKAIESFVQLKSSINNKHEFAIVLLEENKAVWFYDFTNNTYEILKVLNIITECDAEDIFDLNSLFEEISKHVNINDLKEDEDNGIPPPFVLRILLMYNRSHTCPDITFTEATQEILNCPYVFVDVLFSHDPVDSSNHCEKIFAILQNIDKKGYSHFFPVGRDIEKLMRSMGILLGHPLQRALQEYADFSL